jgi:hypothetical protein
MMTKHTGGQGIWNARTRPRTVTRGLPYIIHPDLQRLRRLVREFDHMYSWRGYASRRMIESQCERLHFHVYGSFCYYGGLPPGIEYPPLPL